MSFSKDIREEPDFFHLFRNNDLEEQRFFALPEDTNTGQQNFFNPLGVNNSGRQDRIDLPNHSNWTEQHFINLPDDGYEKKLGENYFVGDQNFSNYPNKNGMAVQDRGSEWAVGSLDTNKKTYTEGAEPVEQMEIELAEGKQIHKNHASQFNFPGDFTDAKECQGYLGTNSLGQPCIAIPPDMQSQNMDGPFISVASAHTYALSTSTDPMQLPTTASQTLPVSFPQSVDQNQSKIEFSPVFPKKPRRRNNIDRIIDDHNRKNAEKAAGKKARSLRLGYRGFQKKSVKRKPHSYSGNQEVTKSQNQLAFRHHDMQGSLHIQNDSRVNFNNQLQTGNFQEERSFQKMGQDTRASNPQIFNGAREELHQFQAGAETFETSYPNQLGHQYSQLVMSSFQQMGQRNHNFGLSPFNHRVAFSQPHKSLFPERNTWTPRESSILHGQRHNQWHASAIQTPQLGTQQQTNISDNIFSSSIPAFVSTEFAREMNSGPPSLNPPPPYQTDFTHRPNNRSGRKNPFT